MIRWSFLKVHQLMRDHNVPRCTLETHPQTRKYLDGNLNFLIPLLDAFTDEDIALHVHRRFNKIFNIECGDELDIEQWLKDDRPADQCNEYCLGWPDNDMTLLYEQVKEMSLNLEGKVDGEVPSTSGGCPMKGNDDIMCISSDSDDD